MWPALLVAVTASAGAGTPPPPFALREVSAAWGLRFRHHHGGSGRHYNPETVGAGVAILDYDGDGDLDVAFVDSGALPGYRGEATGSVLFRNDGGHFVDVTAQAGFAVAAYGMGITAGDADGDGDVDLYVTAFGPNQLLRNDGDGTFTDVTAAAGVGDPQWNASATFFDSDGDGDLDLYVTAYLDFDLDHPRDCRDALGQSGYCHPEIFGGLPDRFYRNRGDGTYEDATEAAGLGGADGKGLGVVAADLDGDGRTDIYVANDTDANAFYRNRGDGTFEDLSLLSGAAYSESGVPEAGMGVALGDVDADGLPDLLVTNYSLETNALYGNLGRGMFLDRRFPAGVAEASYFKLGFGTLFTDLDLDGDLDLAVANGHILDNVEQVRDDVTYAQPNQLFENRGGGRFREVAGSGMDAVRVSRGLAEGDLDGDGDLDLVITNNNDEASVYENVSPRRGGWLALDLRSSGANAWAVGARATLVTGARRQVREVVTAASFLSQSASTLSWGLGAAPSADALEVRWPGGRTTRLLTPPSGRRLCWVE